MIQKKVQLIQNVKAVREKIQERRIRQRNKSLDENVYIIGKKLVQPFNAPIKNTNRRKKFNLPVDFNNYRTYKLSAAKLIADRIQRPLRFFFQQMSLHYDQFKMSKGALSKSQPEEVFKYFQLKHQNLGIRNSENFTLTPCMSSVRSLQDQEHSFSNRSYTPIEQDLKTNTLKNNEHLLINSKQFKDKQSQLYREITNFPKSELLQLQENQQALSCQDKQNSQPINQTYQNNATPFDDVQDKHNLKAQSNFQSSLTDLRKNENHLKDQRLQENRQSQQIPLNRQKKQVQYEIRYPEQYNQTDFQENSNEDHKSSQHDFINKYNQIYQELNQIKEYYDHENKQNQIYNQVSLNQDKNPTREHQEIENDTQQNAQSNQQNIQQISLFQKKQPTQKQDYLEQERQHSQTKASTQQQLLKQGINFNEHQMNFQQEKSEIDNLNYQNTHNEHQNQGNQIQMNYSVQEINQQQNEQKKGK